MSLTINVYADREEAALADFTTGVVDTATLTAKREDPEADPEDWDWRRRMDRERVADLERIAGLEDGQRGLVTRLNLLANKYDNPPQDGLDGDDGTGGPPIDPDIKGLADLWATGIFPVSPELDDLSLKFAVEMVTHRDVVVAFAADDPSRSYIGRILHEDTPTSGLADGPMRMAAVKARFLIQLLDLVEEGGLRFVEVASGKGGKSRVVKCNRLLLVMVKKALLAAGALDDLPKWPGWKQALEAPQPEAMERPALPAALVQKVADNIGVKVGDVDEDSLSFERRGDHWVVTYDHPDVEGSDDLTIAVKPELLAKWLGIKEHELRLLLFFLG